MGDISISAPNSAFTIDHSFLQLVLCSVKGYKVDAMHTPLSQNTLNCIAKFCFILSWHKNKVQLGVYKAV
jgi:hypothetical protein